MNGNVKSLYLSDMNMLTRLKALEPVIGTTGVFHCAPDWRMERDWAKRLVDFDLWYVAGGIGRMSTTVGTIELYPGRGLWMQPGRHYEAVHDPASPLHVVAVHFLLRDKTRTLRPIDFVPSVEIFDAAEPDYCGMALTHVVRSQSRNHGDESAALLLKSLLLEIVSQGPTKPGGALRRHHQLTLAPVIAMMREKPERRFTVGELSARTGYSSDHFLRVFRSLTGDSPKEFMIRQRIERALALLKESSHTVTQIAEILGYDDLGFFSRQFKARVGLSPDRFRRR